MNDQPKQSEWHFQWTKYQDDSIFLFKEWIYPNNLETFRDKDVVDCGCGGGQHAFFVAPYAKSVTAIDLNTIDLARERNKDNHNVFFLEGDLANIKLANPADAAFCIGVLQHTVDPDKTFDNIKKFVKSGGKLIIWCYSKEGNWPNWFILEPLKRLFILKLSKKTLNTLAFILTILLYPIVYTLYMLPVKFLPYYQYFGNFRKLTFERNKLNVFDKLNAPITNFITRDQVERWFNKDEFKDIFMDNYKNISWRASATKL